MTALSLREQLDALARGYHRLQREHQDFGEGSARRHVEDELLDVRGRIDRLLDEWVPDEELREEWRRYLEHHGPEPDGPPPVDPPVFRGVSDVTGSEIAISGKGDDLEVRIDGAPVVRIAGERDFASTVPPLRFDLDGAEYRETFEASNEAIEALRDFLESEGQSPPWNHATELLADGIVDANFGVTPRGRRALASPQHG
jgi:hypothetical protein